MSQSEFDRLGHRQFERLCQTLLVHQHGADIQAWGGAQDGGADAYCSAMLQFPDPSRRSRGPFVFQVKFVEAASQLGAKAITRLRQNLAKERAEIERRIAEGVWFEPRHYVLMTNVRIPPSARPRVIGALSPALASASIHLLDRHQIDTMVTAAGDGLRRSFPSMLSFRDLSFAVQTAVERPLLNRSQAFLRAAQELASTFVTTAAYVDALAKLHEHSFVVLTGAPEMGKTSIARMLAVAQSSEGWDVVDCRDPADFDQAFDGDRKQLFVADDVFGSTEYQPSTARKWAASLPQVIGQLDIAHWFIWTSRSAPLREGIQRLHLQGAAERFPAPASVTVDVSDLGPEERALLLLRHCQRASLTEAARELVVRHGAQIVSHPRFTPQRASRFASQANRLASSDHLDVDAIIDTAMSDITGAMRTAFNTMNGEQHMLLVSLLDTDAEMRVEDVEAAYDRHRQTDGSDGSSARELLALLEEQVLQRIEPGDRYSWAHPSWRDLVIVRVMDDSAKRQRFLSRCSTTGVELAASNAGGSGERQRPFLHTRDDWQLFGDRVLGLADTRSVEIHRRLLLTTANLQDGTVQHHDPLNDIAGELLDQIRQAWDANSAVIPPDVLELYYEVSTGVTPLRPGPHLDATYEANRARMASRISRSSIADYDDALAFIQIVGRNEPRALLGWRYPSGWERGLSRLVTETGRRVEAAERLLRRGSKTAHWERQARTLSGELLRWRQMLVRMRRHAPTLAESVTAAEERLRRAEHELQSWLLDLRRADPGHQRPAPAILGDGPSSSWNDDHLSAVFRRLLVPETAQTRRLA